MRAPLSWIRDYVELPDDVTSEQLAAELTALGLKLEALEKPGDDITGPLVVGRVLTMEPEPQKNGKTINWCTVDVGDANGTGEPQGIVCGAHNFAARRPRRGGAARRRAARRLRDLGAQDLRPPLRGHDLLGPRARSRRRPRRHHRAAGRRREARRRRVRAAPPARRGHRVRDQPRPRLRALAARHRPRGGARLLGPVHRPGGPRGPRAQRATATRSWSTTRRAARSSSTRTVTGFDPAAPTPSWMSRRLFLAGMRPISLAVDVTNYVMLELGQPIHGYDGDKLSGPIRVRRADRGGAAAHPRRCRPHALGRGPADHRRLRADRPGRCDGRRDHRAVREPTTHVVIEAAHFDAGLDLPHPEAAQAALRGVQALRARRRPAAAGRTPPTGSPSC